MPPRSRLESLPAELLPGILTRCSRSDLVNLAQTRSNLRAVCRKELVSYPFTMEVTSDNLKSWVAYFRREGTLLTWGARSLDITTAVTLQDLIDAFDDVDPTVFDVNAQPIHPDASRILPLPSSLRKLSLKLSWMPGSRVSSDTLLLLLLRSLPERCPHIEDLTIQAHPRYQSDEFDRCIRRLTHLRKLHLNVGNLPIIPNRLSLLPASLTDLYLSEEDMQTQEEVTTTIPWVRGIRKIELGTCAPRCIANVLMILSRGGATHLTELILRGNRNGAAPAAMVSLREALTLGLQEFSLLQPPLRELILKNPSAWSSPLHLSLLHTAVASTLTQLYLEGINSCIFPFHLPWPRLQSLELNRTPKMGYQGPLAEPIFPALTAITMFGVDEIQAQEDLFPVLETIHWQTNTMPEQVASLVRHDIKRIDIVASYADGLYEPLLEALGGHTIDLIAITGYFSHRIWELTDGDARIFPRYPNIRKFTIGCEDYS